MQLADDVKTGKTKCYPLNQKLIDELTDLTGVTIDETL